MNRHPGGKAKNGKAAGAVFCKMMQMKRFEEARRI